MKIQFPNLKARLLLLVACILTCTFFPLGAAAQSGSFSVEGEVVD